MDIITEKTCSKCGETKPLAEYHKDKHRPTGYTSQCKACRTAGADVNKRREYIESYRAAHKDHHKEYSKQWYAKNREKKLQQNAAWVKANKEHHRKLMKTHYDANPDYYAERNRRWIESGNSAEWRRQHPGYYQVHQNKRRVRLIGAGGELSVPDWLATMRRASWTCVYCGSGGKMTIDHFIALSRGGTNSLSNIVVACKSCNNHKYAKEPHQWVLKTFGTDALTRVLQFLKVGEEYEKDNAKQETSGSTGL